jgi:hypothetical protein
MIIDFRYHVVSLVAVFLALGLGIIVGINFGKNENLGVDRQIERLEQTYQKIREDQKLLQTSLQTKEAMLQSAEQFQKAILPNLILNRLLGKRIAIIRTNDAVDFNYAKNLVNMLKQAGAEVTSVTTFLKPLDLDDPQFKAETVAAFGLTAVDEKNLPTVVWKKTLESIIGGAGNTELLFLQNNDYVKLWGEYNRGYTDTLIFFGGANSPETDQAKNLDLPLLESLRRVDVKLIGVEPSFVTQSYMRQYQAKLKGTIDNVGVRQ